MYRETQDKIINNSMELLKSTTLSDFITFPFWIGNLIESAKKKQKKSMREEKMITLISAKYLKIYEQINQ